MPKGLMERKQLRTPVLEGRKGNPRTCSTRPDNPVKMKQADKGFAGDT